LRDELENVLRPAVARRHVARRNLLPTLLQNLLQPLLFTFVFGKVMTSSGIMPRL